MTTLEALEHAIEAHQDMYEADNDAGRAGISGLAEYTEAHKEAFIEIYEAYRELTKPDSYSVKMYRQFTEELNLA